MKENLKKLLKKKGPLAENEVKDLLKSYGIRTTKYRLVSRFEDLKNTGLKFPVALKVCSSKILHKTDVGGVKLDIKDLDELKKTFKIFKKKFPKENLLVDQMEKKGVEIIIGLVFMMVTRRSVAIAPGLMPTTRSLSSPADPPNALVNAISAALPVEPITYFALCRSPA